MAHELQHYGVPGMKWGVRKNRAKAAKYAKLSKEAQTKGKARKSDRLKKKSQSYTPGNPAYVKRMKRNLALATAAYASVVVGGTMLAATRPEDIAKFVVKAEKTRLSFVLRNDVRMPRNNRTAAAKDFIKQRRGSYKITSL